MVKNCYRYTLVVYREDGGPLGQYPVEVDWGPASAWSHLAGIRQGRLSPGGSPASAVVEPVFDTRSGQPYVAGVHLVIVDDQGERFETDVPVSYFAPAADVVSEALCKEGFLKAGELFRYVTCAYPGEDDGAAPLARTSISVEEVASPLPLREARLQTCTERSEPILTTDEVDIPVLVRREVLREAAQLSRRAGSLETGGILIGHLDIDRSVPDVFLEVTAQIPVGSHARSELTRLTFTADTWSAVRDALSLRKKKEIMLGWWHSHSYMKTTCKDCEKQQECKATACFMSYADVALHKTCFPKAYSVALVVGETLCSGLSWALFGYRYGLVSSRGFHLMKSGDGSGKAEPEEPVTSMKGERDDGG